MSDDWIEDVAEVTAYPDPEPEVLAMLEMKPGKKQDDGTIGPPSVLPILPNLTLILEQDTRWTGRLSHNQFAAQYLLDDEPMKDIDESAAAEWLGQVYRLNVQSNRVGEAMRLVASRNGFHPVREYLDGLVWDGNPRVEAMLHEHFGVKIPDLGESSNAADIIRLHRAMSKGFMVSAVARIRDPGCKVDTTLLLVGAQGDFKSTGAAVLAVEPQWFSDTPLPIGEKDAMQALPGVWIYEFTEMESFRGRRPQTIKAFLTSQVDRFRPSYGRYTVPHPRQTIFVATSNDKSVLMDSTGSRRFWPVEVGTIDVEALQRDRDQLWAEAVVLYRAGEHWWLPPELEQLRAQLAGDFTDEDPWEGRVVSYLSGLEDGETVEQILSEACRVPIWKQTPADARRVIDIIQNHGGRRVRPRSKGRRPRLWQIPDRGEP